MESQTSPTHPSAAAALTAGLSILAMTALGPLGDMTISTAAETGVAPGLDRAIAAVFAVAALDIASAWGLYLFFRPAHAGLSLLAAWFRLGYAAVLFALLAPLVAGLPPAPPEVTQAAALAFKQGWGLALGAFGVHLILLGVVGLKAPYLPSLLGVLLIVSGLGYLVDALGPLLWPGYSITAALYTFFGEPLLGLWLVIKGWRLAA